MQSNFTTFLCTRLVLNSTHSFHTHFMYFKLLFLAVNDHIYKVQDVLRIYQELWLQYHPVKSKTFP